MDWQPIETAPKDGTRILAYWPDCYSNNAASQVETWFGPWGYSTGDRQMANTMYLVTKSKALLGVCVEGADGWRFRPNTCAHSGSRKGWPSAVKCIPKWAFDASDDLLTKQEWDALRS